MPEAKADFPSPESVRQAAWLLRCEPAALWAVARVEAGAEGAFLDSGEPVILFERHVFSRLTQGTYDGSRADLPAAYSLLSSPRRGGYGPVSVQHAKLAMAARLGVARARTRDAALMSCSWGLFQLMGENYRQCGYDELQRFINAMYRSVDDHLRAFTMFIGADSRLVDALRAKNWPAFARRYNGPAYAANQYDVKLASAYASSLYLKPLATA